MTASSELIHDRDRQSFWLWKKAVEQRTGVRITADRERALVKLLQQRMRELQYRDINQYFADSLDDARGAEEWSRLVDNLLIQETSFFPTSAISGLCGTLGQQPYGESQPRKSTVALESRLLFR